MPQQSYDPGKLKAYREAALELRELSFGVKGCVNAAAESGELHEAKAAIAELKAHTEAFMKLRNELGPTGTFLAKYNVVVHDVHTVSFVLPKGVPRIEVLNEAQPLVHGRDLTWPNQLTQWKKDPKFTRGAECSERICIDGHVAGGDAKNRQQQGSFLQSENLSMPELEDLAVAFAVHWGATGEPLFGWYRPGEWTFVVRAVGGALSFHGRGVCVHGLDGGSIHDRVAVAARLR